MFASSVWAIQGWVVRNRTFHYCERFEVRCLEKLMILLLTFKQNPIWMIKLSIFQEYIAKSTIIQWLNITYLFMYDNSFVALAGFQQKSVTSRNAHSLRANRSIYSALCSISGFEPRHQGMPSIRLRWNYP